MKKKLFLIYLFIGTSLAYSQDYLDNTPVRYFNPFKSVFDFKKNEIKQNKIKKIIRLDAFANNGLRRDSSLIVEFDNDGNTVSVSNFNDGRIDSKWNYKYKNMGEIKIETQIKFTTKGAIYDTCYQKNYIGNTLDLNKNIIYSKRKDKNGRVTEFKYTYNTNSNIIKKENIFQNKVTTLFEYNYEANVLRKYLLSNFNYDKALPSKIISENVTYNYDDNKNCNQIIIKSKYVNIGDDTYNFTYNDKKLMTENYNIYLGNEKRNIGNINYTYEKGVLIKIIEKSNINGSANSELFYDGSGNLSTILSKTESDKYVNIYRYFNTMDKNSVRQFEFSYDGKGNLVKMINTENNSVKSIYEYIIEYY